MTERYYAPEWCAAKTMAYLLDMGESTFRTYVSRGDLPGGMSFNGLVRWHRERTLLAFEGVAVGRSPAPVASNDNVDPIMAGIKAHGASKAGRSATASARPRR